MDNKNIRTYRDLLVWQKAMQFVMLVYRVTKDFPKEELYGLVGQMRKSAVSIPSNIAEGYGRNSTDDYCRFLQIAIGSLFEIQTQSEISRNLKYIDENTFQEMDEASRELERMLSSMIPKIKRSRT
jgi:four helix bundle protein